MPDSDWSPARRVAFRFAAAYLFLYLFPFPLSAIPVEALSSWWDTLWVPVVKLAGLRLFGVRITVMPNGSGDTTFNYVQVFCFAVVAAVTAIVWSILDRRRMRYDALHHWLRVYVRFGLATAMLSYGAVKVIQSQFLEPTLDRLLQPFGSASPMGLLWTFMGASAAYNVFTGAGEMLGGLLLTARRTTSLGALVCIAVMSNVVMLNFAYDVPVKLFSLHLLAMAVFLLLPDLGRLANVLVFNRPAPAVELRPVLGERWRRWAPALRSALVIAFAAYMLAGAQESRAKSVKTSPLKGIWNVEEFALNGQPRPPLLGDADRWRRLAFDRPTRLGIQMMNDTSLRYFIKLDQTKRTMTLTPVGFPARTFRFTYTTPAKDVMMLDGLLDNDRVRARLRRVETPDFLLTSRGFHWISEYPFNR